MAKRRRLAATSCSGTTNNTTFTIVGVVSEVAKKPGMHQDAPISREPVFYVAAAQTPQGFVNGAHIWFQPSWIVRTRGPIQGLAESCSTPLPQPILICHSPASTPCSRFSTNSFRCSACRSCC